MNISLAFFSEKKKPQVIYLWNVPGFEFLNVCVIRECGLGGNAVKCASQDLTSGGPIPLVLVPETLTEPPHVLSKLAQL